MITEKRYFYRPLGLKVLEEDLFIVWENVGGAWLENVCAVIGEKNARGLVQTLNDQYNKRWSQFDKLQDVKFVVENHDSKYTEQTGGLFRTDTYELMLQDIAKIVGSEATFA